MLPPVLEVIVLPVEGIALLVETGVVWDPWLWVVEEVLIGWIVEKLGLHPRSLWYP